MIGTLYLRLGMVGRVKVAVTSFSSGESDLGTGFCHALGVAVLLTGLSKIFSLPFVIGSFGFSFGALSMIFSLPG